MSRENVTVVLVHGAWADGSSWAKVIGQGGDALVFGADEAGAS